MANTGNDTRKRNGTKIAIVVMIIIIILLLLTMCGLRRMYVSKTTAVIEKVEAKELNPDMDSVRIIISPSVIVKNGVMQNLDFTNLNKGRNLRCTIKVDDISVYESCSIAEGETLKGDYIDTSKLKKENAAVAEIRSFDKEDNLLSQTNVKLKIHCVS